MTAGILPERRTPTPHRREALLAPDVPTPSLDEPDVDLLARELEGWHESQTAAERAGWDDDDLTGPEPAEAVAGRELDALARALRRAAR